MSLCLININKPPHCQLKKKNLQYQMSYLILHLFKVTSNQILDFNHRDKGRIII